MAAVKEGGYRTGGGAMRSNSPFHANDRQRLVFYAVALLVVLCSTAYLEIGVRYGAMVERCIVDGDNPLEIKKRNCSERRNIRRPQQTVKSIDRTQVMAKALHRAH